MVAAMSASDHPLTAYGAVGDCDRLTHRSYEAVVREQLGRATVNERRISK